MQINKLIKLVLAILLFLCLLDMPYGFYQLVRFLAVLGFGYLGYQASQKNNIQAVFVYIALVLLFQPFFKISLGRAIWNIVDVLVAVSLMVSLFVIPKAK